MRAMSSWFCSGCAGRAPTRRTSPDRRVRERVTPENPNRDARSHAPFLNSARASAALRRGARGVGRARRGPTVARVHYGQLHYGQRREARRATLRGRVIAHRGAEPPRRAMTLIESPALCSREQLAVGVDLLGTNEKGHGVRAVGLEGRARVAAPEL